MNSNYLLSYGSEDHGDRKVYIVYMGALPRGMYSPSSHHLSLLQEVVQDSEGSEHMIRSYKRSFNGFAARLTDNEATKLSSKSGVVSVFRSTNLELQTTRSWDFLGLQQPTGITAGNSTAGSDIIVGMIDSGVWPELPSFNDRGLGPAPAKWKGACKGGANFTCNKKLIGARYYSNEAASARDADGHGSHTASTAAGSVVPNASFYGLASGVARGGLPSARIAAYRVCDPSGCSSEQILAAFDDAIADGVDVISISIGASSAQDIDTDVIAIGGFHAAKQGVLTVHSAGNSGPDPGTLASVAPWLLSVAASTIDRKFRTRVVLGNGKKLVGNSVNPFRLEGKDLQLVYGGTASRSCEESEARACSSGCLEQSKVKGKIVVCDYKYGQDEALKVGAKAVVYPDIIPDVAFLSVLPAAPLDLTSFDSLVSYARSGDKPVVKMLVGETVKESGAPAVASFSSRGPNMIIPDILKPDVSAPGVDILAGWSPEAPLTDGDKRRNQFNVISGTSMACPHVTGVAAYVKSRHPDWSPSAIKSAIITTATAMRPINGSNDLAYAAAEFAYGSGQVDPMKAANPGLVYEATPADYVRVLCSLGYDTKRLRAVTGDKSTCPAKKNGTATTSLKDFNYPSIAAAVDTKKPFKLAFSRTVTNVGGKSTYRARVVQETKKGNAAAAAAMKIGVTPEVLSFGGAGEKKSFKVSVAGGGIDEQGFASASLVWTDGVHSVRSPIVIYTSIAAY
ncbi:unnamed protein product [Linum trigynum]